VVGDGRKGWTSRDLPVVGWEPGLWSVAQASALLGPPTMSEAQLRTLIRCASLQPVGKRQEGYGAHGGRHSRVYKAADLIRMYETVFQLSEEMAG
jgi:hypothetical protein